jgi:hypothetical protein
MSRLFMTALAALALVGCGDPVADGRYPGEPLFVLEGRIEGDAGTSSIRAPYLGVVWFAPTWEWDELRPQVATSLVPVRDTSFPGDFRLELFDPPPVFEGETIVGGQMVIGTVVALDDVDGNGRFDFDLSGRIVPPDLVFGVARESLAWIERPGNPVCLPGLFTNPDAVEPRRLQLAASNYCTGYEILPDETPFRLVLFPPRSSFPDTPPGQITEPNCDEFYPDCGATPDDPMCRYQALFMDCYATQCPDEQAAFDACVAEHCRDVGTDTCPYLACAPEYKALGRCQEALYVGGDVCTPRELCRA